MNVLCGARLTDQGIISGIAHDLLRLRKSLGAEEIRIFADVDVKHSAPLANRTLEEEVAEMTGRGGADAVIVSGRSTGDTVDSAEFDRILTAAGTTPVLIGSGADPASAAGLCPPAAGIIVGSALKQDGLVAAPVDETRARKFVQSVLSGSGRST